MHETLISLCIPFQPNRAQGLGLGLDEVKQPLAQLAEELRDSGLAARLHVEEGWDDYLLLHHFDERVALDVLQPPPSH